LSATLAVVISVLSQTFAPPAILASQSVPSEELAISAILPTASPALIQPINAPNVQALSVSQVEIVFLAMLPDAPNAIPPTFAINAPRELL
jgi:hypothetical protein